jgi:hypothetical protein
MKKLLTIGAVAGIALGSSYVGATLAQTKTLETTAPDLVVDGVEYTLLDVGMEAFADMVVTTEESYNDFGTEFDFRKFKTMTNNLTNEVSCEMWVLGAMRSPTQDDIDYIGADITAKGGSCAKDTTYQYYSTNYAMATLSTYSYEVKN